jgi:Flp pilus assembly protein TadG
VNVGRRLIGNQRGSALIEFALVSPLLIMIILAALQFGLMLRANAGLRELAGWAGRQAVVSYQVKASDGINPAALKTLIENEAMSRKYNLENGTLKVVTTSVQNTALLTVNEVGIKLNYDYPISVPFLGQSLVKLSVDRTFYVPN